MKLKISIKTIEEILLLLSQVISLLSNLKSKKEKDHEQEKDKENAKGD